MSKELTETNKQAPSFSLTPRTLDEAMKYAELISKSDIVPPDYKGKAANVLVAVQMGMELGLPPLQALQNIAVINGRPCVYGDSLIAIARSHPSCEYISETFDDQTMTATCKVKRRNGPEEIRTFSQADATLAGLWGSNTWKKYPKRMLQMRARGFAVRDVFPDALRGIALAEEVQDMKDMGTAERIDDQPRESKRTELPDYPDDKFQANAPTWQTAIASGKKTPDDVLSMIGSKYKLNGDQIMVINAMGQPVESDDDFVAAYDKASEVHNENS